MNFFLFFFVLIPYPLIGISSRLRFFFQKWVRISFKCLFLARKTNFLGGYNFVAHQTIDSLNPPRNFTCLNQRPSRQKRCHDISPHYDSLGARNGNPPSLLNRTTLDAAYSPARRRIISPPDRALLLVDCVIS